MSKVFVFGLDGMPYSMFSYFIENGIFKNISTFMTDYQIKEIESVIPVVSSVAWTSFSTGTDSGSHGIYGFIEPEHKTSGFKIPLSYDIKKQALWQELSEYQKKTAVINVPVSYPPYKVNGVLVSCFLCPDINKAAYPEVMSQKLKEMGYIIDADTSLAYRSKSDYMNHLMLALEKRFEAGARILEQEDWDYYHLHIMETDRLMHFFWVDIVDKESPFHTRTMLFFQRLDEYLKSMLEKISDNAGVIIVSDHGFCGIKYEVQINRWLIKEGLLKLKDPDHLESMTEDSICYSLLPGRIYINVKGSDYDKACRLLESRLRELECPYTGEKVIDQVYFREDLYHGPYVEKSADITLLPKNGYDLKGAAGSGGLFTKSALNGMHTLKNALLCGKNMDITNIKYISQIASGIKQQILGD